MIPFAALISIAIVTNNATADVPRAPVLPTGVVVAADTIRFELTPTGNEARYRVREQLAGVDFPNDAVGKTANLSGGLSFDGSGKVIAELSTITVDMASLKSDRDRRDNFVRMRTLETAQHPTAQLKVKSVSGLPWPLPTSGSATFDLVADFVVRGQAIPTTWKVTASFNNGSVTGSATTSFTFEQAGLTKPRVAVVLSVEDEIKLEYDFTIARR